MDETAKVFLVVTTDYDYHGVIGLFSTLAAAEAHRNWLEENARGQNTHDYHVSVRLVDAPRGELDGAWLCRVDRDGAEIDSYFSDSTAPDTGNDGPLSAKPGHAWHGGYQAWGADQAQALARARAGLAAMSQPATVPASSSLTTSDTQTEST